MSYIEHVVNYWKRGYTATCVDHPVFRFYGRILKPDFGLGGNFERLVDFGCGQGAAVNFFCQNGFNARGVDISETDIGAARIRYPNIADRFSVCSPKPSENEFYGFRSDVSVVTAIQSLYYLSDTDFAECIHKIYDSMLPGGVFFATMMGSECSEFYNNSTPAEDGLREVEFKTDRVELKRYFMSFITSEDHLKKKFSIFNPVHIGFYTAKFRSDEGNGFHYTFCGTK